MNYPQELRYGGLDAPLLLDKKIRRRRDGLDGGTLKYLTQEQDSFLPGDAPPDLAGMTIEDAESEQVGEIDWEHNLMCIGIMDERPARREIGYPRIQKRLVGWDELNDSIITTEPDAYDHGTIHATYGLMICVESPRENIYGSYWRVQPQYQGLIGNKPTKRQITVNEEVVNPADPIVVDLSGGWSDARKAQISLPKIVVRDTNIVTIPSPTAIIPGNASPPSAPHIQVMTITGTDLTWRWPRGWKLASIDRDEIPGTTIAIEILTYEYVWQASF